MSLLVIGVSYSWYASAGIIAEFMYRVDIDPGVYYRLTSCMALSRCAMECCFVFWWVESIFQNTPSILVISLDPLMIAIGTPLMLIPACFISFSLSPLRLVMIMDLPAFMLMSYMFKKECVMSNCVCVSFVVRLVGVRSSAYDTVAGFSSVCGIITPSDSARNLHNRGS
jgi:hypothetical protein